MKGLVDVASLKVGGGNANRAVVQPAADRNVEELVSSEGVAEPPGDIGDIRNRPGDEVDAEEHVRHPSRRSRHGASAGCLLLVPQRSMV